jgi:hypothetical protein
VHPNEVYEIGDKNPAMPDTEEGRYWLMSAKEPKASKLTNPTPWISGDFPDAPIGSKRFVARN